MKNIFWIITVFCGCISLIVLLPLFFGDLPSNPIERNQITTTIIALVVIPFFIAKAMDEIKKTVTKHNHNYYELQR
jgi:hypothetical protein